MIINIKKFKSIKSWFFSKVYFVLLIISLESLILCQQDKYVYFPLKRSDNSAIKNIKNITEIMSFLYLEPLVSEFNIGSPEQKTNIIFRVNCYYTYLTSYNHNSTNNDQASKYINLKYRDLNYFNEDKSQSFYYYEMDHNLSKYAYDNQFFSKCISENVKINNNNIKMDLLLANSIEIEEPGAICLQLEEQTSVLQFTPSFPILLKKNYSLIDNYKWFIYFGQKNEKDYLVIGSSPYEFKNPETGKKVYPSIISDKSDNDRLEVRKVAMMLSLDDIYLLSNSNEKESFEDYENLKAKFIPNMKFIVGTVNYSQYIEKNIFEKYMNSGKCHKEIFKQRPNLVLEEYTYYYCEESLYNDIKSVFKKIIFKSVALSALFELTFEDLFIKQNGYLIFMVIFSTHEHKNWDFGTIFMKKYQFDFDFQNKRIGYYHINRTSSNEDDNNKSIWINVLIIFGILILSGALIAFGIYLGRKYFKLRKKRANELEDDDFEYNETNNQNRLVSDE